MLKYYAGAWKIFNSWGYRPIDNTIKDEFFRFSENIFCTLIFVISLIVLAFAPFFIVIRVSVMMIGLDAVGEFFVSLPALFYSLVVLSIIIVFPLAVFFADMCLTKYLRRSAE